MLNLKYIPIIFCTTLIWAGAKLEAEYSFKSTINLKRYDSKFVEIANSRSTLGDLNIILTHTNSKKEDYSVKITSLDFDHTTSFSLNSKTNILSYGSKELLNIHTKQSSQALTRALATVAKEDLTKLISKIDASSLNVGHRFDVKKISLNCKQINVSNRECEIVGKIKFVADKNLNQKASADDVDILVKHLNEVKSEMTKTASDYDINGYREFLDKCESLVKNALNSVHSSNKKEALVEIRRKLISERVDSYEYTAIRSRSIVGFVDTLIKLI